MKTARSLPAHASASPGAPGYQTSLDWYARARELFPYGAQLFSRRPELGPFGQGPIYFERARNARFRDVDDHEFIDTVMGFGPFGLGYCYQPVDEAVKAQIGKGLMGSINSPLEIQLAEALCEMVPCAEMVRFCKSGGEANAIAVRLARAHTGRDLVLFCGYHGWHDWYLAANLASSANLNAHLLPGINAKGVPSQLAGTCIPFEFNNLPQLAGTLSSLEGRVACIIMEPVRFTQPVEGYLQGVRRLADEHGCVLVFDEVVTGFRLAPGGAQEFYGVTPDIATYAKAIANGYSLAAVAGRKRIFASQFDNFISSTYWSDTTALAAGLATLNEIRSRPVIPTIHATGRLLMTELDRLARAHGLKAQLMGQPCSFTLTFDYGPDSDKILTLYMQEMIARGIYVSSVIYPCFTHTPEDVDQILAAANETFGVLARAIEAGTLDRLLKCPVRQPGFRRLV